MSPHRVLRAALWLLPQPGRIGLAILVWVPVGIASVYCSPLQSLLKLRDLSSTQLCSNLDLPVEDLTNQIALVARGNCTFYEKVRLAQASGARALLIVSKEKLVGCPGLCHLWVVGQRRGTLASAW